MNSEHDRQVLARNIPPFAALRSFEAVGRLGAVRRAAIELSIHHSAVSRNVAVLEKWIGVDLTELSNGRTILTDAGKAYHRRVTAAMRELADATREVMGSTSRRLVVWCSPGLAFHWLSHHLDGFITLHPNLDVEMHPSDNALIDFDEFDICEIRYGNEMPGNVPEFLKIGRLSQPLLIPVASPSLAATLHIDLPQDILHAPLLHDETDDHWRRWLHSQGLDPTAPLVGRRFWHAHLTLDACRRGQGIALANELLLAKDIAEGTLVPVTPASSRWSAVRGGYYLLARELHWHDERIGRFRRWIEQQMVPNDT